MYIDNIYIHTYIYIYIYIHIHIICLQTERWIKAEASSEACQTSKIERFCKNC